MPYYGESVKRERIDKFFSDLLTGGTFFLAGYVLEVTLRNASNGFGWTRKNSLLFNTMAINTLPLIRTYSKINVTSDPRCVKKYVINLGLKCRAEISQ
jgi:hypothetical protein